MARRLTPRRALAVVVVALVGLAIPAWAYWAFGPTQSTSFTAATLGAPTAAAAAPLSSSSIRVSWAAPASPSPAPSQYRVNRTAPSTAEVCTVSAATLLCDDTGLTASTLYSYSVTALLGTSWVSTAATASATTPAGSTPNFLLALSPAGNKTAGTAFTVTLTARNNTTTDTTYTGAHTIVWSGLGTSPAPSSKTPVYPATTVSFTNGVATTTLTATGFKAETASLTATEGSRTGSVSVTINAAPVLTFSTCTSSIVKNSTFTTTVKRTSLDPYSNPTSTSALTVDLLPFDASGSNHNFVVSTVTIAANALESPAVTYHTANGNGTSTFTGSAAGYVTASCSVTTTN